MPAASVRLPLEAAFVVLVAVGAWLAEFHPALLIAAVALACVLVALLERAGRQVARPAIVDEPVEEEAPAEPEPPLIEAAEVTPVAEPEPEPEPELAVSERSARAILATGPPPAPEPPRRPTRVAAPRPKPEPEPVLNPEPEPAPPPAEPPREWSIWELQRLIRDRPDDSRQEEWAALVHSLRDFARADGTLPVEFDELVRDSFGSILGAEHETEAAAAR
jgi:hypothetical protein